MVVIDLTAAGGIALLVTGIVQDQPVTALLGVQVLAFLVCGLVVGSRGGPDDWDAGDGDA